MLDQSKSGNFDDGCLEGLADLTEVGSVNRFFHLEYASYVQVCLETWNWCDQAGYTCRAEKQRRTRKVEGMYVFLRSLYENLVCTNEENPNVYKAVFYPSLGILLIFRVPCRRSGSRNAIIIDSRLAGTHVATTYAKPVL